MLSQTLLIIAVNSPSPYPYQTITWTNFDFKKIIIYFVFYLQNFVFMLFMSAFYV